MKPLSYSTFYLLKNRQLTELENGLSTPWTNYLESSAFVLAEFNQGLIVPLSISALLEQTTPSSEASTCEEALNEYLTNSSYQSIEASYIPMVNQKTGVYDNRIEVIDVQAEGWNVQLFNINYPSQTPTLNDIGTTDDLLITPPSSINPNDVLISINGVLHSTSVNEGNIWVLDGMGTIKQSKQATVLALVTTSIGGHTTIPITSDMIHIQTDNNSQRVVLSSSSLDFSNSSVFVSVDGYLQMFTNTYQIRDNSSLIINTNKLDYINNFIYSPILRNKEDVFGLKNESVTFPNGNTVTDTVNQGTIQRDRLDPTLYYFNQTPEVSASTLQSTAFLQSRLTSPHSFIICINNPWLFVKEYTWQPNNSTTCFECFIDNDVPRGTLFVDIGWTYPYTVLSNPYFAQHLLYVNSKTYHSEIYKTGYNLLSYPAPWTDITHRPLPQRAWMKEIYTGTLSS